MAIPGFMRVGRYVLAKASPSSAEGEGLLVFEPERCRTTLSTQDRVIFRPVPLLFPLLATEVSADPVTLVEFGFCFRDSFLVAAPWSLRGVDLVDFFASLSSRIEEESAPLDLRERIAARALDTDEQVLDSLLFCLTQGTLPAGARFLSSDEVGRLL